MLEAYSTNVTVPAGGSVPFENLVVKKGIGTDLNGSTITIDRCGLYNVVLNAAATTVANLVLLKDGVPQPQAQAQILTASTASSFDTNVTVATNNTPSLCTAPTQLSIQNTGTDAATLAYVSIKVIRV